MLRNRGLVPSLLSSLDDPYVKEPQPYWGGQPVWADMLATMNKIPPYRGTQFYQETRSTIMIKTVTDYLNGQFPTAKEALDAAANQIASATGLPIAQ